MFPDFRQINERAAGLLKFDELLQDMFGETQQLKAAAVLLCQKQKKRQAMAQLRDIPVEELKHKAFTSRICCRGNDSLRCDPPNSPEPVWQL